MPAEESRTAYGRFRSFALGKPSARVGREVHISFLKLLVSASSRPFEQPLPPRNYLRRWRDPRIAPALNTVDCRDRPVAGEGDDGGTLDVQLPTLAKKELA